MKIRVLFKLLSTLLFPSLALAQQAGSTAASTCFSTSDSDPFVCMGNGVWCCDDSNSTCACQCKQGWKGSSCSTLDLLPIQRSNMGVPTSTAGIGANWGAGVVYEGGYWHAFVGAKTDISDGASDEFAQNHGIVHLRSSTLGGSWENMGELKGNFGGTFGFRVDIKPHPNGGWLLMTEGHAAGDNRYPWDERFGFIILYSKSVYGPWTERLAYRLGRAMLDGSKNWQADPSNTDNNRWDCRMADPTFAVMETGDIYIGYRGTKCCCDNFIGAWGETGEHEVETAGMLHASSWEGPFERVGTKIFEAGSDNEDMYMWRDSNSGVHMLMHSQRNDHHNHERRGAHAYSPDGQPDNWKLSHDEAWPTFLYYDDCGADAIVKRQRPSLVFDPETGEPTHLVTGVASSHHGLEWGDGFTVFQPISSKEVLTKSTQISGCGLAPCPVGSIADGSGGCDRCAPSDIPGCLVAASSPSRDQCICTECVNGMVGEFCDTPKTVESTTCPNDGWKLLPGTNDGRLFRCGEVINAAHFDESSSSWVGGKVGGWWGNCVPAGVINNNEVNCGDRSDEGAASAICQWPFVAMEDGTCKECDDNDVSDKCVPGQSFPSETQQSCVCQKCMDGWIGNQCDIDISGSGIPTARPSSETTIAPVTPSPTVVGPSTNKPTQNPTPTCTICDDVETSWQIQNGFDCATDTVRMNNRCNKDSRWTNKGYCRLSCYNAGNGYPGDVCCDDTIIAPVTPSPTVVRPSTNKPSPKPTPACTICDDVETKWQIQNGFDCATDTVRVNDKCNKDSWWTDKGYCRLSCYNAGNGYPGDVCCVDTLFDRKYLRGR